MTATRADYHWHTEVFPLPVAPITLHNTQSWTQSSTLITHAMVMGGVDCFCELGLGGTLSSLGVDGHSERPNEFHCGETHTEEGFCAFLDVWMWGGGGRVWGKEAGDPQPHSGS